MKDKIKKIKLFKIVLFEKKLKKLGMCFLYCDNNLNIFLIIMKLIKQKK